MHIFFFFLPCDDAKIRSTNVTFFYANDGWRTLYICTCPRAPSFPLSREQLGGSSWAPCAEIPCDDMNKAYQHTQSRSFIEEEGDCATTENRLTLFRHIFLRSLAHQPERRVAGFIELVKH